MRTGEMGLLLARVHIKPFAIRMEQKIINPSGSLELSLCTVHRPQTSGKGTGGVCCHITLTVAAVQPLPFAFIPVLVILYCTCTYCVYWLSPVSSRHRNRICTEPHTPDEPPHCAHNNVFDCMQLINIYCLGVVCVHCCGAYKATHPSIYTNNANFVSLLLCQSGGLGIIHDMNVAIAIRLSGSIRRCRVRSILLHISWRLSDVHVIWNAKVHLSGSCADLYCFHQIPGNYSGHVCVCAVFCSLFDKHCLSVRRAKNSWNSIKEEIEILLQLYNVMLNQEFLITHINAIPTPTLTSHAYSTTLLRGLWNNNVFLFISSNNRVS